MTQVHIVKSSQSTHHSTINTTTINTPIVLHSYFVCVCVCVENSYPQQIYFFFKKIYLFIYLFDRRLWWNEGETEIFYLPVHSPNAYNKQGQSQEPETTVRFPICVARAQAPGSSSVTFSHTLAISLIGSRATKTQTGAHVGCQNSRWQLKIYI